MNTPKTTKKLSPVLQSFEEFTREQMIWQIMQFLKNYADEAYITTLLMLMKNHWNHADPISPHL